MSNQYNDALIADVHMATKGETLDVEKNLALFRRVIAGDASAREEMIAGNMPLAVANVEGFIRQYPEIAYLRDDLTSAAFVGLVKAVNKMAAGKGPRKTNCSAPVEFMGMWINRELAEFVDSETTIRLPARSKYRAQAEGRELTPPTVVNDISERCASPSYQRDVEIRDLIEFCCTSDTERTFVAMRREGHTLAEIAKAFGTPVHTVSNMKRKLKARIRATIEQSGQLPPPRTRNASKRRTDSEYYQSHRKEASILAKTRRREKRGW